MNKLVTHKGARPAATHDDHRGGFPLGLAAYALWGVLPIYFKLLGKIPPVDIVAHRILWSLPFLAVLIAVSKGSDKVRAALRRPRTLGILMATALLIGGNWLLYVYSVTSGHILAASFGYYLNPLANVLLGRFVLHERLNRLQWTAVAIAAAGISVLALGALGQLWISLALCASFALYGLLRKIVPADAVTGLAIETTLLFPFAIAWLGWLVLAGQPAMGFSSRDAGMLMLAGIVSTTPLLLFTAAAE
ncbi:MAG: EamA family transporter RarD [Pseudomonadota bacterium]